ncbi:hypothetical protein Ciccas_012479, partial [Cichlidogyrus casuarinus]
YECCGFEKGDREFPQSSWVFNNETNMLSTACCKFKKKWFYAKELGLEYKSFIVDEDACRKTHETTLYMNIRPCQDVISQFFQDHSVTFWVIFAIGLLIEFCLIFACSFLAKLQSFEYHYLK